jgi:hypothetical protein
VADNKHYFAARAIEERRLAMASADQKVRSVHLEMAARYDALASREGVAEPEREQRA